jgi:hypothetical protein
VKKETEGEIQVNVKQKVDDLNPRYYKNIFNKRGEKI